jgi:hypothetical protein
MSSHRQLLWVAGAAVLGFGSSGLFSGLLHWGRAAFVLVHSVIVAVFLTAYIRLNRIEPLVLVSRRWIGGTIGGITLGIFLARRLFPTRLGAAGRRRPGLGAFLVRRGVC